MYGFLERVLQCPHCGCPLGGAKCPDCGRTYTREGGVYDFVVGEPEGLDALGDAMSEAAAELSPGNLQQDYESFETAPEQEARRRAGEAFTRRLTDVAGVAVEIATGMGGIFNTLLTNDRVCPVATDISIETLQTLKTQLEVDEVHSPHAFLACDARDLPFRDKSLDAVVSAGGFNNIARTEIALTEAARTLSPEGRCLILSTFVSPESESAVIAAEHGVETAYLQDQFAAALKTAGFGEVSVEQVVSVEATDNPYDLLPVAGDTQRYAVVECRIEDD